MLRMVTCISDVYSGRRRMSASIRRVVFALDRHVILASDAVRLVVAADFATSKYITL
jgi:hypothetical protein